MKATFAKRAQAAQLEKQRQAFLQSGGKITQCPTPDWEQHINRKTVHLGAMTSPQGGISA